jgi:hypothetical protein
MKFIRYLAIRLVPYIAVAVGLFALKSAWAALVGYHIGIVIALSLAGQWRHGLRLRPGGSALWLVSSVVVSSLAGYLLFAHWDFVHVAAQTPSALRQLGLDSASWLPFILYFSLVNPWLEEIYWRGWLGSDTQRPILDDLWFGGYHLLILAPFVSWPWLLVAFLVLAGTAWAWRQVTRLTGSLFFPGLAHLLADFSILSAIFLRTIQR